MSAGRLFLILILALKCGFSAAQSAGVQQGIILKTATSLRLGSIHVLNVQTRARGVSTSTGVFSIPASKGDTLQFTDENYTETKTVVTGLADEIVFMDAVKRLDEVVIRANSLRSDLKEAQLGYHRKSVFYTGTPHYYYVVLKPMTFIYENFKSEVIEARRFNRFARREIVAAKVAERFNDLTIKKAVDINDADLQYFKDAYTPTIRQLNVWNDFDLFNYIRLSYADFKENSADLKNRMSLN